MTGKKQQNEKEQLRATRPIMISVLSILAAVAALAVSAAPVASAGHNDGCLYNALCMREAADTDSSALVSQRDRDGLARHGTPRKRGLKAGSSEVLMETVTRGAKPNKADAENVKVQMQDVHFTNVKSPPRVNQQGITLAHEGFSINVVAKRAKPSRGSS